MKLLHIDSSVLGAQSASRELTAAVVARWRAAQPGLEVIRRDLDAAPVPHLSLAALSGSDAEQAALTAALQQELFDANVLVIGAPMYNFAVPSTLRAWIDRVVVAGKTFRYGPNGVEGLAGGRRAIIVSSRGGAYGEHSPADFQEGYLRQVLGFIGITDVQIVRAEGIATSTIGRDQAMREALTTIDDGVLALAA